MVFILWDLDTRNIIGEFDTEEAALADVREAFAEHGAEYVATLGLVREDRFGRGKPVAMGPELVERVRSVAA